MVWLVREGTSARRSVGGEGEREGGRGRIRNSETCLFHTSYCLPRLPFHCLLLSRPSLFQQHVLPYHSVSYITASFIRYPSWQIFLEFSTSKKLAKVYQIELLSRCFSLITWTRMITFRDTISFVEIRRCSIYVHSFHSEAQTWRNENAFTRYHLSMTD